MTAGLPWKRGERRDGATGRQKSQEEGTETVRILITGADTPLAVVAASTLRGDHELRLTGADAGPPVELEDLPYTRADLREPDQVTPLLEGVEAVAHLEVFPAVHAADPEREKEILDRAARGTFVLLHASLAAGVRRLVLASRLDLMAAYPESYVVDETWKPQPDASATALAPYLAELTVREFARAENLVGVCLRMGELGSAPDGTTPEDAAAAIHRALTMDLAGRNYHWWLYHICSTDRYPLAAAENAPLSFTRAGT